MLTLQLVDAHNVSNMQRNVKPMSEKLSNLSPKRIIGKSKNRAPQKGNNMEISIGKSIPYLSRTETE